MSPAKKRRKPALVRVEPERISHAKRGPATGGIAVIRLDLDLLDMINERITTLRDKYPDPWEANDKLAFWDQPWLYHADDGKLCAAISFIVACAAMLDLTPMNFLYEIG